MKAVLEDIQSGKFVQDWMMENKVGARRFKAMRRRAAEHDIEIVGQKLRDMLQDAESTCPIIKDVCMA
ncbi:MAG TPA: hypothetical protein QF617_00950 [Arenicellales bacterium]|jgi:ketol-acid reductoisomerase|uniref:KARI C-terminal knotted domain-containing protein n=1 Tax=marine metagenome TaxID=408172 RepID=A0A382F9Q0_9ZZZZ|nr:hypothetical protein [Arenicellales bacterium]|tara:strand:+ start:284 stop:487 length:204 start_codon:yes stop_codon:yes gene_type:complete